MWLAVDSASDLLGVRISIQQVVQVRAHLQLQFEEPAVPVAGSAPMVPIGPSSD
jgi:hypothetical protein